MSAPVVIDHAWIPMSDGCLLAAKIWLPPKAHKHPVPAVLEYIPYRKRDHKADRDARNHGFFARNGYAGVRVDLRGSGDSQGVLRDEYLQQELDDGLEVLRWIANQPWCSGKVGMFGISWGGFNGLQIAALQPPELGAVVAVCASDDRYADDVHYMGGCLLTDNLSWASTMFSFNACPPDPEVVGENWRQMWLERLEGSGLWLKTWLEHQHRDRFWRHASVCEDYTAIKVPVLAVSGWADGYSNAVFRLLENLHVPRRGLVGPWGHSYPHMGGLGPRIDFLGECLRWWDRWLKGEPGQHDEPPVLRAWIQDSADPLVPSRPGRWVAETRWPAPSVEMTSWRLGNCGLVRAADQQPPEPTIMSIQSPLSVGLFAGKWCSYAEETDLPWDQREEDGGALVFDTAVLEQDIEILGAPEVELDLSADKPVALVAVRLSDLAPNDRATRVTFGILNLTHRNGHDHPAPLVPGRTYRVRVPMNVVGQRFPRGHRIRLAVSSSYWPLAWPAPEPARLTLSTEGCRLFLPQRNRDPREGPHLRDLGRPREAPGVPQTLLVPAKREWRVTHNLATNGVDLHVINNDATVRLDELDLEFGRSVEECYSYSNNNYDTVRGEIVHHRTFQRRNWHVHSVTRTILTSTRTHFILRATLDAYEGDVRLFSKTWDESVPRVLV